MGRGVPHLRSGVGGTPSQIWGGGNPIPGLGWGVPHPGLDCGSGGVPHPRSGVGGIPSQVLMVGVPPWLGLDGGGLPGVPPG